ncbi:energy transducer TonB [Cupriavidus sp. 30B13]|uniref:energy transducer TonB n=1 Tax=Cupriavidus sp. 30B13 TaxID=3384241 RepID=UPI003B921C6A
MEIFVPSPPWRARAVSDGKPRSSAHAYRIRGAAFTLLLHGLALFGIVHYAPPASLASAGRPVSGAGVRVTLVSAPAAAPAPAPEKPAPVSKPAEPRRAAPRHAPVLASDRSQAARSVPVETTPVASPTPPEPATPPAPPTAQAAAQSAAQTAPAAINRELNLPGANAVKDVARIVCHFAQPPYPAVARRLRHEGTVTLRVTIDVTGRASQVDVDTSSGFAELDAAAVQTLRAGRCDPYVENGLPASVRAVQSLAFNLTN